MAVDAIAAWRAQLDHAEKVARKRLAIYDSAGMGASAIDEDARLILRLVAGHRRLLEELQGAARSDEITFVEQRPAPPELPHPSLLPGLRRAAELVSELLTTPERSVRAWLDQAADQWEKGGPTPSAHPLVASLFLSLDVPRRYEFERGVLEEPQDVTVVFTATLDDETRVEVRRQVRMQVVPS
ncbi:hypothetical protein [Nonomuraea sp. NPDC003214]